MSGVCGHFFSSEEAKLIHPNWYHREPNLKPYGKTYSQISSQY
jgi:hypothetical protein